MSTQADPLKTRVAIVGHCRSSCVVRFSRGAQTVIVVFVLLLGSPVFARLSDFVGLWRNPDQRGQLVSLRIRVDGNRLTVQAEVRCESAKCDWGVVEALAYGPDKSSVLSESAQSVSAVFKQPDREVLLILSLDGQLRRLKAELFTHFTDNSGRVDFVESCSLEREVMMKMARPPEIIPQFPWPPPRASAMADISRSFLVSPTVQKSSLAEISARLVTALEQCGYVEKSFYAVPEGFALATQLEQIDADGTSKPAPDRWSVKVNPLRVFSLTDYLKALFTANPGRYRVIVFVVTSHPFSQSDASVSQQEAQSWLSSGLNTLPKSIGDLAFTSEYTCTALVYEFEEPSSGNTPVIQVPSELTGRDHLSKSGLWPALESQP